MQPRYYQAEAVRAFFDYYESGKTGNALTGMPTGTGKSLIIALIIAEIMRRYPQQRILMLTHVKELIQQNYQTLLKVWPNAPAGIYSAGLNRKDSGFPITYAGIGSVAKKANIFQNTDVIIIDEAHLISTKGATMYRKFIDAIKNYKPYLIVHGLTATPFRLGQGMLTQGEGALFDAFSYDITGILPFNRLIDEGFIAPLIPLRTKVELDTEGLKTVSGEFNISEMQERYNVDEITIQALEEAIVQGYERKHWLIFATGVEHCDRLAKLLTEKYDIPAKPVHSKLKKAERDENIAQFKSGEIRAVVNNNVLCLDSETEILTSDGFVGMDEMTYSHKIAAWKKNGSIEFTNPRFIVKRNKKPDEKMIRFGGDSAKAAKIRVTGNHRMVKLNVSGKYEVVSASSMIGKAVKIPVTGNSEPIKIKIPQAKLSEKEISKKIATNSYNYRKAGMSKEAAKKLAIERTEERHSMVYKNPDEVTISECNFIGFWLGDGSLSRGRCYISQSERYLDNIQWLREVTRSCDFNCTEHRKKPARGTNHHSIAFCYSRGTGFSHQKRKGYYSIEPYLDKEGCDYLLNFSKDQLLALLEGFHKADGNHHTKSKDIGIYITGTQISLYSKIQEACSLRGINSTISKLNRRKTALPHHKDMYRFSWNHREHWVYPSKSVYEDTTIKNEKVWCVTSTTSFLICRRKGKVFVTGNTTGFDMPGIDLIIVLRPTMSSSLWIQMLGRATRPCEGKQNALVLDFAANTRRLGPINDPVIPRPKGKKKGDATAPVRVCDNCGMYCHASVTVCPNCGYEFPKIVKIRTEAAQDELIRASAFQIEVFTVNSITYDVHSKQGKPDSMKISYQCGMRSFSKWVCLEHPEPTAHMARDFWRTATTNKTESPPKDTKEAIERSCELLRPSHIRVRLDTKFPQVLDIDYSGTRFGAEEPDPF